MTASKLNVIIWPKPGAPAYVDTLRRALDGHVEDLPCAQAGPAETPLHLAECQHQLLEGLPQGEGASVIAFGAWGSGKSSVLGMLPPPRDGQPPRRIGLLQQALKSIFLEAEESSPRIIISISCFEILGEESHDLLLLSGKGVSTLLDKAGPEGSLKHYLFHQERQRQRQRHSREGSLYPSPAMMQNDGDAAPLGLPGGIGIMTARSGSTTTLWQSVKGMWKTVGKGGGGNCPLPIWDRPPPAWDPAPGALFFGAKPAKGGSPASKASRPLQVQSMSSIAVASIAEAESLLDRALARRAHHEGSSGRSTCHISHAVIRISWRSHPSGTEGAAAAGGKRLSSSRPAATTKVACASARIPASRTLTLLDCCSQASTLLLPDRPASAAKLGILSLGNALGKAHLGESSMGLREAQLTRALIGSVDRILLLACLGGSLDAPLPTPGASAATTAAGHGAASLPAAAIGAPVSPLSLAASGDEATAQMIIKLGEKRARRQLFAGAVSASAQNDVMFNGDGYPGGASQQGTPASLSPTPTTNLADIPSRGQRQRRSSQLLAAGMVSLEGAAALGTLGSLRSQAAAPPPPHQQVPASGVVRSSRPSLVTPLSLSECPSPLSLSDCPSPSASHSCQPSPRDRAAMQVLTMTVSPRTPSSSGTGSTASSICRWEPREEGAPQPGMRPRWCPSSKIPRPPGTQAGTHAGDRLAGEPRQQKIALMMSHPLTSPRDELEPESVLTSMQPESEVASIPIRTMLNGAGGQSPTQIPSSSSSKDQRSAAQPAAGPLPHVPSIPNTPSPSKRPRMAAAALTSVVSASTAPRIKPPSGLLLPPRSPVPSPARPMIGAPSALPGSRYGSGSRSRSASRGSPLAPPATRRGPSPAGGSHLFHATSPVGSRPERMRSHQWDPPLGTAGGKKGIVRQHTLGLQPNQGTAGTPTAGASGSSSSAAAAADEHGAGDSRRRSRSALSALYRDLPSGPNRTRLEQQYTDLLGEFHRFVRQPTPKRTLSRGCGTTTELHQQGQEGSMFPPQPRTLPKLPEIDNSCVIGSDASPEISLCAAKHLPPSRLPSSDVVSVFSQTDDEDLFELHIPDNAILSRAVGNGPPRGTCLRPSASPSGAACTTRKTPPPARMRSPLQRDASGKGGRLFDEKAALQQRMASTRGPAAGGRQVGPRLDGHGVLPRPPPKAAAHPPDVSSSGYQRSHLPPKGQSQPPVGGAPPCRSPGGDGGFQPWAQRERGPLAERQRQALRRHCLRITGESSLPSPSAALSFSPPGRTTTALLKAHHQRSPRSPKAVVVPSMGQVAVAISRLLSRTLSNASITSSHCSELVATSVLVDKEARLKGSSDGGPTAFGAELFSGLPSDVRMLPLPSELRYAPKPGSSSVLSSEEAHSSGATNGAVSSQPGDVSLPQGDALSRREVKPPHPSTSGGDNPGGGPTSEPARGTRDDDQGTDEGDFIGSGGDRDHRAAPRSADPRHQRLDATGSDHSHEDALTGGVEVSSCEAALSSSVVRHSLFSSGGAHLHRCSLLDEDASVELGEDTAMGDVGVGGSSSAAEGEFSDQPQARRPEVAAASAPLEVAMQQLQSYAEDQMVPPLVSSRPSQGKKRPKFMRWLGSLVKKIRS